MAVVLRTHASSPALPINSMSVVVPGGGGTITFDTVDEIRELAECAEVYSLATTPVYSGEPALYVNDGVDDIASDETIIRSFLTSADQVSTGPYSELRRDENGDPPPDSGGGTGITDEQHKVLRQLAHFADNDGPLEGWASGAYREATPTGTLFPTLITWYTSNAKTSKYMDVQITYSGAFPTNVTWRMYNSAGSGVIATVSDAITYSGAVESSRTRTITVA